MKKLVVIYFFLSLAFAAEKQKPKIVIQVVESQRSEREFSYTRPGTANRSTTTCDSTARASDTGGGTATVNGTTNCTTRTTPGTPPQTTVTRIPQINVQVVMPNGTRVTLWCQRGFRRCNNLLPGSYDAEVDGNSVWMDVHDLGGGRVHKTKYTFVGGW